jgi:hypothetical protein
MSVINGMRLTAMAETETVFSTAVGFYIYVSITFVNYMITRTGTSDIDALFSGVLGFCT